MAESKGSKRYGKSPKIVEKGGADEAGDEVSGAGAPMKAASKAKSTAASGDDHADKGGGAAPEPNEVSGTDHIPVSEVHQRERKEMHTRHERERRDMHTRHEQEHKELHRRQLTEIDGPGVGDAKAEAEKTAGKTRG